MSYERNLVGEEPTSDFSLASFSGEYVSIAVGVERKERTPFRSADCASSLEQHTDGYGDISGSIDLECN